MAINMLLMNDKVTDVLVGVIYSNHQRVVISSSKRHPGCTWETELNPTLEFNTLAGNQS